MRKPTRILLAVVVVATIFGVAHSGRAQDPGISDMVMINIGASSGTYSFSESSSSGFGSSSSSFGSEFAPAFAGPFAIDNGAVLLYDDPSQSVVSDQIWVQNGFFYFASGSSLQDLQALGIPVVGGVLETPGQPQDVSGAFGQPSGSVVVVSDVPEPGSLAVAGAGLACLVSFVRRRK